MKSERRHELHTNILANWLTQAIETIRPHANTVLTVALLVILVLVAVNLWHRYSSSGNQQAWDAFNQVIEANREPMFSNPAAFEKLVEEYPRSEMTPWASITAADLYLQQGCEQVLRDKTAATHQLQKAVDNYESVLSQSQVDPLRERATFGIARAYEALAGTRRAENELQKAIDSYQSVVKNWPQGAYVATATRRLEQLKLLETKRFYDQLAQYDPKPIFSDAPGQGPGFNLGTVPQEPEKKPDSSTPATPASKPPAVQKSSPAPEKAAAPPEKTSAPAPAAKTAPAKADAPAATNKPAAPAPAKPK